MTKQQGSTHTPGKWTLEGKIVAATIDKGDRRREVRPILEMIEGHQTAANAKLIAAAPELIEALKAASDHLDYCGYGDSWERERAVEAGLEKQIAAAIDKAEGPRVSGAAK